MLEFHSFLKLNNILLYVYTTFCLSTHPWMDTGFLPPLVVVNNAAMHVGVPAFRSLGYIPGNGIALHGGSLGSLSQSLSQFPCIFNLCSKPPKQNPILGCMLPSLSLLQVAGLLEQLVQPHRLAGVRGPQHCPSILPLL